MNKLILGDNIEIMKTLEDKSVDLIYLDPPFFSNRNYEIIWGDEGEIRSFKDRWAGGIDHYIAWLKERVEMMHRLLKNTGSLFLHCDWHANAYIRVYILDKIFGIKNFRNEIVWQKIRSSKKQANQFGNIHDMVYVYSKGKKYTFNQQFAGHDDKYLRTHYNKIDEATGRIYRLDNFSQAGQGVARKFGDVILEPPKGKHWIWSQEKIDEGMKNGMIILSKNNIPSVKRYFDALQGQPVEDIWTDIPPINSQADERIGYPTQKPEALMERIIKCASKEGDVVLDPFMGGGTTAVVAEKLGRKWIGIDQSVQAIKVSELRLDKQSNLFSAPFSVQLHKYDYDTLRNKDSFEFEQWIIQQFGGTGNTKQRGDLGLDGKMPDHTPIQAKRQDNIGRNIIDNFISSVKRADKRLYEKNIKEKKPVGYIIAFSFGKGAIAEVARLRLEDRVIIKLVTVEEIVPIAMKPAVTVNMQELSRDAKGNATIEFTAEARSEVGIEFYSWDFDYDAEKGFKAAVIREMEGRQSHPFKAGMHTIAVKAVDNEGLESIETVKLKVNGVIKKMST